MSSRADDGLITHLPASLPVSLLIGLKQKSSVGGDTRSIFFSFKWKQQDLEDNGDKLLTPMAWSDFATKEEGRHFLAKSKRSNEESDPLVLLYLIRVFASMGPLTYRRLK